MNKVTKNRTANVGRYSYQYVDIAQIHDYLESKGYSYKQQTKTIDGNDYVMTQRYVDGKWEDEWLQGLRIVDATLQGVKNPAQEQGSAVTYARRYSLLMAFGLATEDDDAQCLSRPKDYGDLQRKPEDIDEFNAIVQQIKCEECGKIITEKVKDYSMSKYNKALCYDCQQKR